MYIGAAIQLRHHIRYRNCPILTNSEMDRQILIIAYDIKILKICFKVVQLLQICNYESCSDNFVQSVQSACYKEV